MRDEIDRQIEVLLSKATDRPGPNDPMNMVGLGSTLLAAQMFTKSTRDKRRKDGNNQSS